MFPGVAGHERKWLTIQNIFQMDASQHASQFNGKFLKVQQMLQKLKGINLGGIRLGEGGLFRVQLVKGLFAHLGTLQRGGAVRVGTNAENGPAGLGRFDELSLDVVHSDIAVFHLTTTSSTVATADFFGLVFLLLFVNVDALRCASQRCSRVGMFGSIHLDVQLGSKEPRHLEGTLDEPLGRKVAKLSVELEPRRKLRKGECLFESSPNTALIPTIHSLEIPLVVIVGLGRGSLRVSNSQQQRSLKEFRFEIRDERFSGLFVSVVDGQQDALFATGIVGLQVAFLAQFFFRLSSPVLLEALVPGQVRSRNPQRFRRTAESNRFDLGALAGGWTEGKRRLWPVLGLDRRQKTRVAGTGKRVGRQVRIHRAGIVATRFVVKRFCVDPSGATSTVFGSRRVEGSHVHQAGLLVSFFGLGHVGKQQGFVGTLSVLAVHSRLMDAGR